MTAVTSPTELAELEQLYRSQVRRVYGYAFHRLGEPEAADVVSEVFHAAAIAFRQGSGTDVTPAWLMAVTRNKVMDHWRRAYRRKAKSHLTHARHDDMREFPDDWTADPRRAEVLAALEALPDLDRGLLVLHHVDGVSTQEIADLLDKSVAATESALARARRKFRNHYRGES